MGQLTESIKRLILSLQISSASPGHINEVLQLDPGIDIDAALAETKSITWSSLLAVTLSGYITSFSFLFSSSAIFSTKN